jgi:tRNA dimethylallyltransferase
LYRACNERFVSMLESGAVEEVRQFRQHHADDAPVTRALGYRPIAACLDGTLTQAGMIEQSQADTRHYAKRQVTWFRNRFQSHVTVTTIDHMPSEQDTRRIIAAFTSF